MKRAISVDTKFIETKSEPENDGSLTRLTKREILGQKNILKLNLLTAWDVKSDNFLTVRIFFKSYPLTTVYILCSNVLFKV